MLFPFANQTSVVFWGARGVGRAITLALARNGSAVAVSDPDKTDLEKLRDLLLSKEADIFASLWRERPCDEEAAYADGMADLLERMAGGHPHFHRIVLSLGVDERFWSSEREEAPADTAVMLGRLSGVILRCADALAAREKTGRIVCLWPSARGLAFDERRAAIARQGREHLADLAERIAVNKIELTRLLVGPADDTFWNPDAADSPNEETPAIRRAILRPGEIADAVVALQTVPRRVLLREVELEAVHDAAESKPPKGRK